MHHTDAMLESRVGGCWVNIVCQPELVDTPKALEGVMVDNLRLNWFHLNEVVDGDVRIEDLVCDEKILPSEIEFITQPGMLESQV